MQKLIIRGKSGFRLPLNLVLSLYVHSNDNLHIALKNRKEHLKRNVQKKIATIPS